jgi:hypothetical protein
MVSALQMELAADEIDRMGGDIARLRTTEQSNQY